MKREVLEVLGVLRQMEKIAGTFLGGIVNEKMGLGDIAGGMEDFVSAIECVKTVVPTVVYEQYLEFFEVLGGFCRQCENIDFLQANREEFVSSLKLFEECMEELKKDYISKLKTCPCCGNEVVYEPLADYYRIMRERYQVTAQGKGETCNEGEYSCPKCYASDRDRLMISFLKKEGLDKAREGMRVLQIAPAAVISSWIERHCPHTAYETTDLYMENVSFRSDIMNMDMVGDETYDVIICSHVLEHVRDDRKALREMKRILKPDGKIVFLVPIDLGASCIDEEHFYVHSLGKEYFGEETFRQCALTDTSTLYILTKSADVPLNLAEEVQIDEDLCQNGPLVSVIMPCYNHEEYVAGAIESVIGQSYKNIEILAGDDGSTDGTASIMRRYSSYFEKEFYLEENTDGELWELLFQEVSGKYVAVAHSDDIWEKDKLALQVSYMESHPECGICFTWCKYADSNGEEVDDLVFIQPNRSRYEWMKFFWEKGNCLCHPSVLIRREINERRKKYPGRQIPDFLKWIDMVQMTSIYVLPKVLVHMTRHRQCTSFPSEENLARSVVEQCCGWFGVIRNMEDGFFKNAFTPYLRNPQAETKEEIQCEKFFLMLDDPKPLMQYNAMCYYFEIFNETERCFEEKYHYRKNDFAKDMIEKGIRL